MSVFAATITRSHVHGRCVIAISQAVSEGVIAAWKIRFCGPYLTNGRNDCVRDFLETDHDTLLFIDSDIAFNHDAVLGVTKAVTPETPVVCGWYRGVLEDGSTVPVAYSLQDDDGNPGFFQLTEPDIAWDADTDPDPLVSVGAVGTGFMAIHRSLIEEMPATFDHPCEWFAEPVMGGRMIGEDLGFCARVVSLGHPILLHRGAKVVHYKELAI